ncbi:hypothetical protein J1N35_010483 [Gossypium stocksii]|uniref:Reverse transcriptase domain-containing protein n=1 Tax=Gossypium stocksii TaxID=47602 RepID=A0A9D3W2A3_9ROSI|nr:hypothetical protein J1N35_010483 [Gossypium stocksii]
MEWSSSSRLADLEMEVRKEMKNVLNHEELLWRQKARCDWLRFEDHNTKYFHSCTIRRRKFNRIIALCTSSREKSSDQSIFSDKAVRFFEKLYGEIPTSMSDLPMNLFFHIKKDDFDFLNKPILNDEIKKALFDMALLKAPESDGQWDLIGETVCEWVQGIFTGNKIEKGFNNALIVSIPKDLSHFRPISICSVMYKLVMKVIANRLKVVFPNYISPEQARFIAGRNISDNIIIEQEVIYSMRIEAVRNKLQNWEARKLSFVGRVTLAQSVLLAIPNYFMQSLLVPKGVWPLCCENLIWSVGDGKTIRGWKDSWIPSVEPLYSYIPAHFNLDLECTLKDWVLADGTWNLELLRLWLSENMIKRIVSIPPPHPDGGTDRIIWARSGSESFSMRNSPITIPRIGQHLKHNWVHLFSDGAVVKDSGNAAAEGVVRDQSGNWIVWFTNYLAVDLDITMLRRVKQLLNSESQWEIKYVNRECNLIADHLAKLSFSWKSPLRLFEAPLDSVVTYIQQDKVFRFS